MLSKLLLGAVQPGFIKTAYIICSESSYQSPSFQLIKYSCAPLCLSETNVSQNSKLCLRKNGFYSTLEGHFCSSTAPRTSVTRHHFIYKNKPSLSFLSPLFIPCFVCLTAVTQNLYRILLCRRNDKGMKRLCSAVGTHICLLLHVVHHESFCLDLLQDTHSYLAWFCYSAVPSQ